MSRENFKPIKAPKRTPKPPPEVSLAPPTNAEISAVRAVLQRLLLEERWDNQGGYVSYDGDGKWSFVSSSLGQITPGEFNVLFKFAGIVPDEIDVVGYCVDCANSDNGRERGYAAPCSSCLRPSHINHFVPRDKLVRRRAAR